ALARHGVGDAVLRPRRRARVRPPLSARRSRAPMRRLAAVALVALAFPAAAAAHATLRSTVPHFGRELQKGPAVIRLHFDQEVKILPGAVRVLSTKGRNYAVASRTEGTDIVAT